MSEVKLPTLGRQVHYFPNDADSHAANNGADVLPATVVQGFSKNLNLAVTCMNPDGPVVLRYSVPHKSEATTDRPYWDWPEIK
ncbi:hypothetical protein [Chitinophaga sp. MM2321]|uniref:hypothetical protein n=1 Tax=Chitinophaga sp. MM2321 TaxID=3137178 RepID=UPI0032D5ADD7